MYLILFAFATLLANLCGSSELRGDQSLARWLEERPRIASALIWDDQGAIKPWDRWSHSDRQLLEHDFFLSSSSLQQKGGSAFGLPDPLPNQKALRDHDYATTVFAPDLAKKIFFAYAAQSLALEASRSLGWSLAKYPADQLAVLLNSRQFFDWDPREKGYVLSEDRDGLASPASPDLILAYLRSNGILAATQRATIVNLLDWAAGLHHDISTKALIESGYERESALNLDKIWQYRGFPPVTRILQGTRQTIDPLKGPGTQHWTAGCWGTTGFLRQILRAVNIPVELVAVDGHALPHFLADHTFLSHGDDPYNRLVLGLPPRGRAEALLIADDRLAAFRASPRIGYRAAEMAVDGPSQALLDYYCRDWKEQRTKGKGSLEHALRPYLESAHIKIDDLKERLAAARKRHGCKPP